MTDAISVEHALAACCEACDNYGAALLICTPKQRMVLCESCAAALLFRVSNVMLPLIAARLEERRRKL